LQLRIKVASQTEIRVGLMGGRELFCGSRDCMGLRWGRNGNCLISAILFPVESPNVALCCMQFLQLERPDCAQVHPSMEPDGADGAG
jgi:hypothetical protein